MCQQNSPPPPKKTKQKSTVSLKPSRKTRTRRRKPKYLSLSLKLTPPLTSNKKIRRTLKKHQQQQQLNLFPLHPELNSVEDNKDMHEDNNVVASFLFDTATDGTTTLDGLLTTTTATTTSEEGPRSPPSLTYAYRGRDNSDEGDSNGLVRTAMRCKERDASEERWVSYSEVVESKKIKEEEGSSCIDDDADDDAGAWCAMQVQVQKRRLLLDLKLDYQEVLNAWSDKGPLYVDGESPQTVPNLPDPKVRFHSN